MCVRISIRNFWLAAKIHINYMIKNSIDTIDYKKYISSMKELMFRSAPFVF